LKDQRCLPVETDQEASVNLNNRQLEKTASFVQVASFF
jgi:hypothetical protein